VQSDPAHDETSNRVVPDLPSKERSHQAVAKASPDVIYNARAGAVRTARCNSRFLFIATKLFSQAYLTLTYMYSLYVHPTRERLLLPSNWRLFKSEQL
jgi:hypothetical protein